MERNCEFFTMVNTGEVPNAKINMAGFDDGDGFEACCHIEGGLGDLMRLACALVKDLCEKTKEIGTEEAAFFVNILGDAILEGAGSKAVNMATKMNDPLERMKLAVKMMERNRMKEGE